MHSEGLAFEYDGSFPGFLCAVAEALNEEAMGAGLPPVRAASSPVGLFEERRPVARDDGRAAALWSRLARRAGEEAMLTALDAFSSDLEGADAAVARALSRLRREGGAALNELGDPTMLLVEKAAARTRAEAHLMKGLVRFSELRDGSWYAGIRPDCRLLHLLGDHFGDRFPDMRWLIHDRRRGTALLHERHSPWTLVEGFALSEGFTLVEGFALAEGDEGEGPPAADGPPVALYSEQEAGLRAAWARYFESVAIAERVNPRLQSNHMPKKYWPDLPELIRP